MSQSGPTRRPARGPDGDDVEEPRPYRAFGLWLKARRESQSWTQEGLAKRLNYSATYVRKIEWGVRPPTKRFRAEVARVFSLQLFNVPDASGAAPERKPIPVPATNLIGRERDVSALIAKVQGDCHLVTLVGAPGIGKTRLATEVAARLDAQFPNGACFVDLVTVDDPGRVAAEIAVALGLPEPDPSEALDVVISVLRPQQLLLVLDNFEHLLGAAPVVGQLISDVPGVRVVATSRERLRLSAEHVYRLLPLETPNVSEDTPLATLAKTPAVVLFVDRMKAARPEFELTEDNGHIVSAICTRLRGIALAIEIVAANGELFDPAELLARLDHSLDLPFSGLVDAPEHHKTLRAAIEWSYHLLGEPLQVLWAGIGVFVGGCTIEAASAVCGDSPAGGGLSALAVKSLIEPRRDAPGGLRFVFLESIRQYAVERLEQSGRSAELARRHFEYFLALAERAEPLLTGKKQRRWLRVLDDEHANLTAALRWALDEGEAAALRLTGALWRFWWIRGYLDEGREVLDAALALADEASGSTALVRALNGAGVLARTQGDYERGIGLFDRAIELARRLGDDDGLALGLLNCGICAENAGDYTRAVELIDQSRSAYAATGAKRGVGHALNCLGMVAVDQGDLVAAQAFFADSVALFDELGDDWSMAVATNNLGWSSYKEGESASARDWYAQSLASWRLLADKRGEAGVLSNLGRVAAQEGNAAAAAGSFEESLLIFQQLGDRRAMAECLEAVAGAALALGDATRGALLLGAAEALRQRMHAPLWPADMPELEALIERLGDTMGPGAFAAARKDGRALPLERAVSLALRRV